jgi:hypothetical protein
MDQEHFHWCDLHTFGWRGPMDRNFREQKEVSPYQSERIVPVEATYVNAATITSSFMPVTVSYCMSPRQQWCRWETFCYICCWGFERIVYIRCLALWTSLLTVWASESQLHIPGSRRMSLSRRHFHRALISGPQKTCSCAHERSWSS